MVKKVARNRVLGDRLWDDLGQVWTTDPSRVLTPEDVVAHLPALHRSVIHSYEGPMRWLDPAATRAWWKDKGPHLDPPGHGAAHPHPDGPVYRARLWTRDAQTLLGFHASC